MSPEEIKALRQQLGCTARELADTLGVDPKTVTSWESGEGFPTRKWVNAMQQLAVSGAGAVKRAPRGKQKLQGLRRLADPRLWEIVRKLAEHPALFEQVSKLAEQYPDPVQDD